MVHWSVTSYIRVCIADRGRGNWRVVQLESWRVSPVVGHTMTLYGNWKCMMQCQNTCRSLTHVFIEKNTAHVEPQHDSGRLQVYSRHMYDFHITRYLCVVLEQGGVTGSPLMCISWTSHIAIPDWYGINNLTQSINRNHEVCIWETSGKNATYWADWGHTVLHAATTIRFNCHSR